MFKEIYTEFSVINMCNVLRLIATDTTLIKSNDTGKSKYRCSIINSPPFQGSSPTLLAAPWSSTTPERTSSSISPTPARRRSPQLDGEYRNIFVLVLRPRPNTLRASSFSPTISRCALAASDIGIEQAKFVGLGQSQVTHKSHRMSS